MTRILVTGASGFIGAALCARLAARGDRVRALVRGTSRVEGLRRLGAELAPGRLEDPGSLRAAVDGCDAVVHLAGAVKALRPRDLFRANALGTRHVAEACAAAAPPPVLLYVSSLAAAGPSRPGRPRVEEDPPAPVSAYGRSKLAGEEVIRGLAARVPATIVRPPIVYGPGDPAFVPALVRMARAGAVLRPGPDRRLSLVHVADLCEGVIAALERGRRVEGGPGDGTYFLEDGVEHGFDEIARAACDALGRRARVVPLPQVAAVLWAAGSSALAFVTRRPTIGSLDKLRELLQPAWTCSSARAARELGYAPRVGLSEGMRGAVAARPGPHDLGA